MDNILDLTEAPADPLRRLVWLSGVESRVAAELEAEQQRCAFEVRLNGELDTLLETGLYSRTRLLRWTRAENRRRKAGVRWSDNADPTSSAYSGTTSGPSTTL